jgi:phosphoribosylanthranilate isomerase
MFTKLKICGITNLLDAKICIRYGVDILGFNFFPESPRYITPEQCKEIMNELPFWIKKVGILVKPSDQHIIDLISQVDIDVLQLYNPPEEIDFTQIGKPIIRCYPIKDSNNFHLRKDEKADMYLLDYYDKIKIGGSGKSFDWRLIPDWLPREKLILAGGVNINNIDDALQLIDPAIIDIASGAESCPGKKDPNKIKALMEKIIKYNIKKIL